MSCKSALYTALTSSTDVTVDSSIPFGTVIRRFGCNCNLAGTGILIDGIGYYDVSTDITVLASAAGTVTVTLFKDGVAVPGATGSATLTAVGDSAVIPIDCLVRLTCCAEGSSLTIVLTGTNATITNVATVVKKI